MFKTILSEIRAWTDCFIRYLPGSSGGLIRLRYLKRRFAECEKLAIGFGTEFISPETMKIRKNVNIGKNGFFIASGGKILIDENTAFNINVHINASVGGTINIGKFCRVGPNVVMRTANHKYSDPDTLIIDQGHSSGDIEIEDDVWIGANVVILGGVKVGRGAVVGAGAVVTRDVPSLAVVGGVPAKILKYREKKEVKE